MEFSEPLCLCNEEGSKKVQVVQCWLSNMWEKNSNGWVEWGGLMNIGCKYGKKRDIKNLSKKEPKFKRKIKKTLKKRKWMGQKGWWKKWHISNFGLSSRNIYLRFFVPWTWGTTISLTVVVKFSSPLPSRGGLLDRSPLVAPPPEAKGWAGASQGGNYTCTPR